MAWPTIAKASLLLALGLATAAEAAPQRMGARPVATCAPVSRPGLLAETAPGRIAFDGGADRVMLIPACGGPLSEQVRRSTGRRFILLVDDLRARQASGAMFSLHLAEPGPNDAFPDAPVLGTLNFFAARPPGAPGMPRRMSYDVTRIVQGLAQEGRLDGGMAILLRPSEPLDPGAGLSVARLQLVEQ